MSTSEHWAEFLIGMRFKVETHHKPLIPLFSTKLIDELPVRIQHFRMRLVRFDFAIAYVPATLSPGCTQLIHYLDHLRKVKARSLSHGTAI